MNNNELTSNKYDKIETNFKIVSSPEKISPDILHNHSSYRKVQQLM